MPKHITLWTGSTVSFTPSFSTSWGRRLYLRLDLRYVAFVITHFVLDVLEQALYARHDLPLTCPLQTCQC